VESALRRGALSPSVVTVAMLVAVGCRSVVDPPAAPPAPAVATAPMSAPPVAPPATPEPSPPPVLAPAATPASEPVLFETSVKPLLARTCTPCHVPGGRMYERMPFDHPDVVLSHRDGILRRLKNPDDREVLERWLATQPPAKI
jgi:hypothetical protein